MPKLSQEMIQKIVEEYPVVGTYSGVAKKFGVSPSTVKKYVELNFNKNKEPKTKNKNIILFNERIPEAAEIIVPEYQERGNWLRLTDKEKEEIDILRGEL